MTENYPESVFQKNYFDRKGEFEGEPLLSGAEQYKLSMPEQILLAYDFTSLDIVSHYETAGIWYENRESDSLFDTDTSVYYSPGCAQFHFQTLGSNQSSSAYMYQPRLPVI